MRGSGVQFLKLNSTFLQLHQNIITSLMADSFRWKSTSTPAYLRSSNSLFEHKTAILTFFPRPAGKLAVPLTICSPFLGLTLRRTQIYTLSLKVVKVCNRNKASACIGLYSISFSSFEKSLSLLGWRFRNLLGVVPFVKVLKAKDREKVDFSELRWFMIMFSTNDYSFVNRQSTI